MQSVYKDFKSLTTDELTNTHSRHDLCSIYRTLFKRHPAEWLSKRSLVQILKKKISEDNKG